jgi:hypothetical protein
MSAHQEYSVPIIGSILHASDFSAASEVAFAHALKAALIAKSQLTIMHVFPNMTTEWTDFPGVRETLARWGLLPPDSPRSAVPILVCSPAAPQAWSCCCLTGTMTPGRRA